MNLQKLKKYPISAVTILYTVVVLFILLTPATKVFGQSPQNNNTIKGQPIGGLLSFGGAAARHARLKGAPIRALAPINDGGIDDGGPIPDYLFYASDPGPYPALGDGSGSSHGEMTNVFVNDPCLDPPPP